MSRMPKGMAGLLAAVLVDGVMLIRDVWQHGTASNREGYVRRAQTMLENADRIGAELSEKDWEERRKQFAQD